MTQVRWRFDVDAVQELVIPGFKGDVVRPGAPDYDASRAVWNVMHDRRPAVIARCESTGGRRRRDRLRT